jgi:uncharacterized membrane protein YphA (DoxX/SURF4 family)
MKKILFLILRVAISVIFIVAGIGKSLEFQAFVAQLDQISSLYENATVFIAIIIIASEIVSGIFLLLGLYIQLTSRIGLLIIAIFSMYLITLLLNGKGQACGCFGSVLHGEGPLFSMVRNLLIFLGLWRLLVNKDHLYSLDDYFEKMRLKS